MPLSERMRILNSNGNVGIGTANPNSKLHIESGDLSFNWKDNQTETNYTTNYTKIKFYDEYNRIMAGIGAPRTTWSGSPHALTFWTGSINDGSSGDFSYAKERMRIESNGNVGIGITSPGEKLHVKGEIRIQGSGSHYVDLWSNAHSDFYMTMSNPIGGSGYVFDRAMSNGMKTYSDKRLKKNINKITNGLDIINQLEPVSYLWKTQDDSDTKTYGFIAQDIEKVLPTLVSTSDLDGYKLFGQKQLVPLLVSSVKELKKENDYLKDELKNLKEEIEKIKQGHYEN